MYAIDQMDNEKAKASEIDLDDFAQLDKLVGRADKADYLSELVGRERGLRAQIEDMSRSRYYLSAVDQRTVCSRPFIGGADGPAVTHASRSSW